MVPDRSLSVDTVAGPREEFVGKSVGVGRAARKVIHSPLGK
ncbi:hypothetical protein LuPra_05116 [Luteitalea pratensis]|uniref:Uncharacterized protein n=1 Tax=Luteitalea pratensis TaxID=1855912 RepID=A0A143PTY6_LUTPR|nr:hypothetical protein LuPra_05116 [Luteitalea pratensis]